MYCIMVGDWRKKNVFYDLTYQTEKIMEKYNMVPFGQSNIIIQKNYTYQNDITSM